MHLLLRSRLKAFCGSIGKFYHELVLRVRIPLYLVRERTHLTGSGNFYKPLAIGRTLFYDWLMQLSAV